MTNHSPLKNRCKQFTLPKLYAMLEVLICAKFKNKNKKKFIAAEKDISKNSNIKTPQMTN